MPEQSTQQKPLFAGLQAHIWVGRETKKPLFGKPYVLFGQATIICGYLFQQSALLGRAFNSVRRPFLNAFCTIGEPTEEGAAYFARHSAELVSPYLESADSISNLVLAMLKDRVHGEGDWWLQQVGRRKLSVDAAIALAYDYSLTGAGFGMEQPDRFLALFDNSYKPANPQHWRAAFEVGLVTTPKQEHPSIQDFERPALEMFRGFCQDFYPHLMQPLGLAR
jgi:hypothetical protein